MSLVRLATRYQQLATRSYARRNIGLFACGMIISGTCILARATEEEVKDKVRWLKKNRHHIDTDALYILINNAAQHGEMTDLQALYQLGGFDPANYYIGDAAVNALKKGNLDVAEFLYAHGAPKRYDAEDEIWLAAAFGDVIKLEALLRNGKFNLKKYDALKIAAYLGHVDIVAIILKNTTRTEYDIDNMTAALIQAAWFTSPKQHYHTQHQINVDHTACMKLLIAQGADANWIRRYELYAGENKYLYDSVLHRAIEVKDPKRVRLLLDSGANPNYRHDDLAGIDDYPSSHVVWSALSRACRDNLPEIVNILIDIGHANIHDVYRDRHGRHHTPLTVAACGGSSQCAQELLEKGADKIQALNFLRWSELVWLASVGTEVELRTYINDISLTDKNQNWQLAIKQSVTLGRAKILEIFIDKGVDINHRYRSNRTLLMLAAERGDQRCMELLIRAGADVDVIEEESQGGHDALYNAAKTRNIDSVRTILSANPAMSAFIQKPYHLTTLLRPSPLHKTIDEFRDEIYIYQLLSKTLEAKITAVDTSASIRKNF